MSGGSYLDISPLYEISYGYAYELFHSVIHERILNDDDVHINGIEYVNDEVKMMHTALYFQEGQMG